MSNQVSLFENVKNLIELVGKLSLGIVGICYALGLLVVNVHFNKYGVYSLSLFQVNYITAGVWAVVPVLLTFMLSVLITWILLHFRWSFTKYIYLRFLLPAELRPRRYRSRQWASVGAGFGLLCVLVGLVGSLQLEFNSHWIGVLTYGATLGLLLVVIALSVIARNRRVKFTSFIGILCLILGLIGHAIAFGNQGYGAIPSHLGGGAPREAQLIVEPDPAVRIFFENAGVHFQPNSNRSEAVRLLLTTEDEYIILISDTGRGHERALSVRRDFLKAVLFGSVRK